MSGVRQIEVSSVDEGVRLDKWFKLHVPEIGFAALQKLMRKGTIRLDGKRVKGKERLSAGQIIRVPPSDSGPSDIGRNGSSLLPSGGPPSGSAPKIQRLSFDEIREVQNWVLYKDDDVIVLNKPAGLPTQGGTGQTRHLDGLLGALKYHAPVRPKLVHRLDKDTSGALLLARSTKAAGVLAKSFASKETKKQYWALVNGLPNREEGRISMKMEKLAIKGAEKMVPSPDGKPSLTDFQVIDKAAREASWLALRPITGRTHQLRLHCAEIGHPIVGDGKYGGSDAFLGGTISKKLHLHSYKVDFRQPTTGELITVIAPLPGHMKASFETLGFDARTYEDPFASDNE